MLRRWRNGEGESLAKSRNQKAKILLVAKMLLEETDDEHGLTMSRILANLAEAGVDAEHKSIYSDIEVLRSFGLDIVKRGGARNTEYAIGERDFRYEELMMLVAAVESSRFLTDEMSANLIEKLQTLASGHAAEKLRGSIQACNGVHMDNRHVFYHIETILSAIENGHRISFRYAHRTLRGMEERPVAAGRDDTERDDSGQVLTARERVVTPICVLYSEGNVYAATYREDLDDISIFRIDHMEDVRELELTAAENEKIRGFDPERFAMQSFGMFSGDATSVTLLVHESCINAVHDRFGEAATVINASDDWAAGEWARVIVDAIPSPQFYGWVAGFAGNIYIEGPKSVSAAYEHQLAQAMHGNMGLGYARER